MQPDRRPRRLAAVTFMDMVGYCRLTAENEEDTLARWKSLRVDVIDGIVRRHRGRVVRAVGDQLLLDHASAADALDCAIDLQAALEVVNGDLPPGSRMEFRIGLHLGDVIDEGDDLFGADVNVAARLEPLAEPGGIVVSAALRDRLGRRPGLVFDDLGALALHNLPDPVRAFRCRVRASAIGVVDAAALRRPSVAVMPLMNLSGDARLSHLATGLMDELIAALARLPSLLVISRNSTVGLVDGGADAARVGAVFGVRYVVGGELRLHGQRIVLTTTLFEGAGGRSISRDRHTGRASEIFALQDRFARSTVASIVPRIEARELRRIERSHPASLDAYDLTMRALNLLIKLAPDDFAQARRLLLDASALDDGLSTVRAWLAKWHMLRVGQGWSDSPDEDNAEAARHAAAAVARDPHDPLALAIHGHFLSHARHDYDAALAGFGRAYSGTPSHAMAWTFSGVTHSYLGEGAKAVEHAAYGLRLSPDDVYSFYLHGALGLAHFAHGNTEAAIVALEESQRRSPNFSATARLLAAAHARAGNLDAARGAARRMMAIEPRFRVGAFRQRYALRDPVKRDEMADLLRLAGVPE